ncbi:MAG: pilus assembly protein PilP [Desulfobulbaceae bacterium]|nr:pilus assembly protein PilP [Desulfobulbaceae bacterium]
MKDKNIIKVGVVFLALSALVIRSEIVSAEELLETTSILEKLSHDNFEYQMEGRSDPFQPLFSSKPQPQVPVVDEIIDVEKPKTGLRSMEPGQLSLVATLISDSNRLAMVQDVTGVGYVLNQGIKVGLRGVVTMISKDQVLIKEISKTRSGKEIIKMITMRLKKEGDK